jgi:thioesterase domain-containing protein
MAECYLSEVRAVQPRGPYFLAGLCFGGLVAFDMAQKLLARGEEVSFLGMFDLLRPPRGMRERWGRYSPLRLISRTWHHLRRGTLRSVVSNELVRMRPPTPATEGRLAQIFQIHQRAMRRYRMRKYPGRVTLFLSDEIRQRLRGRPSEWDRWAAGGLEIVPVSGHHGGVHSFIREPHVAELAEKLAARLASTPLIRTPG